eukprot:149029-Alexandrium_andersonii.AAC.1
MGFRAEARLSAVFGVNARPFGLKALFRPERPQQGTVGQCRDQKRGAVSAPFCEVAPPSVSSSLG